MKVIIKNLGCKVNNYECEFVRHLFIKNGFNVVEEETHADIYVVNTCTVTNTSDKKSKKIIRKIRRENPTSVLVVMGCAIEYTKKDLKKIDADVIIGNKDKSKIVEYVNEFLKNKKQIIKFYDMSKQEFEDMEIEKFETKTRAFVKIQDGCNNFCSYCIIPYVRGRVRSKSVTKVIKEITSLVNSGHKEIVLTGIHTGQYMDNDKDLSYLLKEILKIKNLYRIRLSSIEITELNDDILELFKNNKIMANHFHIPLQSGCDKTLKDMNRKYNTEYFKNKIKEIRNINPNVSISTDLIVGFPTETENDFIESYYFCKEMEFSKIHVFPYSDRDGTIASKLSSVVNSNEKKIRTKKMIELSNNLEQNYFKKCINNLEEIIIEEEKDDFYIGHTSNYIKVYLKGNYEINQIYNVKLKNNYKDGILGEVTLVKN